jgi:UPF0271 protein
MKKNQPYLINCDMGESFGNYQIGNDEALMPYINAANIACGGHAGDPVHIESTIDYALKHQVTIGAHPGYPDREGFGRRIIPMSAEELGATIRYQVSALVGLAKAKGGKVTYVKPHGALYNHMANDMHTAQIIIKAIREIDPQLKIMGLAGSHMKALVEEAGSVFIPEAFADRTYETDGKLRSRKLEGALIHDPQESLAQVNSILQHQRLRAYDGSTVELSAESFCIHGDNPAALDIAKTLHEALNS